MTLSSVTSVRVGDGPVERRSIEERAMATSDAPGRGTPVLLGSAAMVPRRRSRSGARGRSLVRRRLGGRHRMDVLRDLSQPGLLPGRGAGQPLWRSLGASPLQPAGAYDL